jgi:hypothetical protein
MTFIAASTRFVGTVIWPRTTNQYKLIRYWNIEFIWVTITFEMTHSGIKNIYFRTKKCVTCPQEDLLYSIVLLSLKIMLSTRQNLPTEPETQKKSDGSYFSFMF